MPVAEQLTTGREIRNAPKGPNSYHDVRFRFDPRRAAVWRPLCRYIQPWVQPTARCSS